MADEEVKDEVVETPEEEVVETKEPTETEQRAMDLGWKPKDKFEGSEDEWRSAKDFIERGEMIGKIRAQQKQLTNVEAALKHIAAQNSEQFKRGYETKVAELKAQKRQALADGDLVAAEDIADKIEATQIEGRAAIAAAAVPAKQMPQVDPDHEPWVKANPWYNDKVMMRWGDAEAIDFINEKQGQVTPAEVRAHVSKVYKEKFGKQPVQAAPNPEGDGRSNRGNTGEASLTKIEQGMSEDHRRIMNTLIRATGMTKKEYLEQYSKAN